jgi:hypothetical protein
MDDEKKSIKLVREFLEFKVLGIEDANIWTVEVRRNST